MFEGYKTYAVCLAIAGLGVAEGMGFLAIREEVYIALGALAGITLRMGVKKAG